MADKRKREIVTLECTECNHRNYSVTKNKRKHTGRIEHKKYCPFCRIHVIHKETK